MPRLLREGPGQAGSTQPKVTTLPRGRTWSRAAFSRRSYSPAWPGRLARSILLARDPPPTTPGDPAPSGEGPEARAQKVKSDSQVCRLGKGATQGPSIKGESQGENYSREEKVTVLNMLSSCSPEPSPVWTCPHLAVCVCVCLRARTRTCTKAQAGCGERGAG